MAINFWAWGTWGIWWAAGVGVGGGLWCEMGVWILWIEGWWWCWLKWLCASGEDKATLLSLGLPWRWTLFCDTGETIPEWTNWYTAESSVLPYNITQKYYKVDIQ